MIIFALKLLTLLFVFETNASLGQKADPQSFPKGICRMTLKHLQHGDEFHCTGSVVGDRLIKTAGHCLENSELVEVHCPSKEKLTNFSVERFPRYNHQEIMGEEANRWQDHALIFLEESLNIQPFTVLTSSEKLQLLLPEFEECLMAGYGGHEGAPKTTGVLNGTLFSPSHLEIKEGLIYGMGQFLFELIPGDSGGALLCHDGRTWYDLGSASAHNWDNQSLYAANFAASSWLKDQGVNQKQLEHQGPWPSLLPFSQIEPMVGETYRLRRFSEVYDSVGDSFYNGDNPFVEVKVISIDGDWVKGQLTLSGSSQFYLCLPGFLCYQRNMEVTLKKEDLTFLNQQ